MADVHRTSVGVPPTTLHSNWTNATPGLDASDYTVNPAALGGVFGTDLCCHATGMTVAYRFGGSIFTNTSTDYWQSSTLAEVASLNVATDAAPSLAVGLNDELYCAFHSPAGASRAFRSTNSGVSWESVTIGGAATGKWPRLIFARERQYLLAYNVFGATTRIYSSTNYLATVAELSNIATGALPCAFRQDRRGLFHVISENGANVNQWTSIDAVTWTDQGSLLTSRDVPTMAYGPSAGCLLAWDSNNLRAWRSNGGSYLTADAGPFLVTSSFTQQVAGVTYDNRGYVWIALQATAGFSISGVVRDGTGGSFSIDTS